MTVNSHLTCQEFGNEEQGWHRNWLTSKALHDTQTHFTDMSQHPHHLNSTSQHTLVTYTITNDALIPASARTHPHTHCRRRQSHLLTTLTSVLARPPDTVEGPRVPTQPRPTVLSGSSHNHRHSRSTPSSTTTTTSASAQHSVSLPG